MLQYFSTSNTLIMQMLHHPYCTKSCNAFQYLDDHEIVAEVIDLTSFKFDRSFIESLLKKLSCNVNDIIRTNEPVYVKHYAGKNLSTDELIDALVQHPILLQRPIFIEGDKAVIGRPASKVLEIYRK